MQTNTLPIRVLLIGGTEDDFHRIRTLLPEMSARRYEIRRAVDYASGLEALTGGSYDVCFLDHRLGTQTGIELLKEARSSGCTTPVILLTDIGDDGADREAMQPGATDSLRKDEISESAIERSIRYSMDRKLIHQELRKEREHRRQAEESLREQLRFQTVLAEISARFVNLSPNLVDPVIEEAQRMICGFLDLDRSTLWQASRAGTSMTLLTHIHQPADGPPIAEPVDLFQLSTSDWALQSSEPLPIFKYVQGEAYFPWMAERLKSGLVTLVSKTEDLPVEASMDREFLRRFGTRSTAVFPLMEGGAVMGCLSFDSMREERDWPESLVEQLRFVAQIFAHAIARAQADCVVRESAERLSLAAASANAGLWSLDVNTWRLWATDKARELFGIDPDAVLTFDKFLEYLHPEERGRIREIVQQHIASGTEISTEYRVLCPDGSVRWMASRGRIYRGSHGEGDQLMGVSVDLTERKQMEEQLQARLREIEELKRQLEEENIHLREEVNLLSRHKDIVARSDAMQRILLQVEQVAPTGSTVLITGETGTGKGLIAQAIHRLSTRKSWPFVTVNCASLPPTLIESELFGREKGAYTGAISRMVGRFEAADEGTLFLDEIGELPLEVQAKLLRVLESGCFERLGSTKTVRVNVRLLAATNRDIDHLVREGRFRSDLYYRLSVFPISIPPLRERPEDIGILVWAFIHQFEKEIGKHIRSIPKRSMEALQHYPWPGNARELRNIIEHAMIVTRGSTLELHLPSTRAPGDAASEAGNLQDVERKHILKVLQETGWRISGKNGAAEILGLKRTTLESRMKKLGIHRPKS